MTLITTLVQTTTHDLSPAQLRLSPWLWQGFLALHKVHSLWRWYRRAELYRNPENFAQLLAGHAANALFGDLFLVKMAAQSLLIATRILECTQQQASLYQEGTHLTSAFRGFYPAPIDAHWIKQARSTWLSPSTLLWRQITVNSLRNRISRIAWIISKIFQKTLKLSMLMMDAADAFYLSPTTANEGIHEGFVNGIKWLNTASDQKDELLAGMERNQAVIERILNHSPFKYQHLYEAVAKTLEKADAIQRYVKNVSCFSNGVVMDLAKRGLNGGMVVAGLADYRPLSLARQQTSP